ncbi:MAG: acyl--CoA ligase [Bauldia sp.]|nr:acyl--CoA ligase [Bauldia sp.]
MLMHDLLRDGAERTPDRVALRWVDRDAAVTYAEGVALMDRMAGALASLGVVKGDRVTVVAHNGMDYLAAMFGAWRLGAIVALVNVKFADELEYYFGDHTPKVVIYTHDLKAAVFRAASVTSSIKHLVCMDGAQDGAIALPELLAANLVPPADPMDESAIAHLSYTSGTTGKPKGACIRHEPTVRATRCIAERLRITASDVSFGPTALSSSYQLVGNLLPQLGRGATANVMGKWTRVTGWDAMDRLGATLFIANPTLLAEVLDESKVRGRLPGKLRLGLSGGGPVPPLLKKAWRDELKLPLVESFGQSELGGFMGLGLPELEPDDAKLGRVGPPLPDKEISIIDPSGAKVANGKLGEIALRGGFMAGYWGRPEKTAEVIRGDILVTGDIGFLDADGCLTMRGRRSELVHVDGTAWYPRDIEEALGAQPGVAQAALVGVKAAGGVTPVAFVVPLPGTRLDPAPLKSAIAPLVAVDLAPLSIRVVELLPMTPTGKIAKAELAASAAEAA